MSRMSDMQNTAILAWSSTSYAASPALPYLLRPERCVHDQTECRPSSPASPALIYLLRLGAECRLAARANLAVQYITV